MGRRLGAVALLALLVRALIPAGYMVAAAETPNGRFLIVQLCDGHSSALQAIDLETGQKVDLKKFPRSPIKSGNSDQPCAFAVAAAFAPPVTAAESLAVMASTDADIALPAVVRPSRGIAAPPPPATGPPILI